MKADSAETASKPGGDESRVCIERKGGGRQLPGDGHASVFGKAPVILDPPAMRLEEFEGFEDRMEDDLHLEQPGPRVRI